MYVYRAPDWCGSFPGLVSKTRLKGGGQEGASALKNLTAIHSLLKPETGDSL